jgi:hypothetical protein
MTDEVKASEEKTPGPTEKKSNEKISVVNL